MSDIAGEKLQPTEETSLSDMIDTGVAKMATQLEEISSAVHKKYT